MTNSTSIPIDVPIEIPVGPTNADALHKNPIELATIGITPDVGRALPNVGIDHDRKGIANIGKDGPLNNGASAQDLINYGIFAAKGDSANLDLTHPDNLRTDQDKIGKVSVKTAEATAAKDANFIVGADGSITVVNNPDNNKNPQLNIVLDKVESNEPEAQRKAADALVAYLETHYGIKGNSIEDPSNLLSDAVKSATAGTDQYSRAQRDAMAAVWGNTGGDQTTGQPPGTVMPPPPNFEGFGSVYSGMGGSAYPQMRGNYPEMPGGSPAMADNGEYGVRTERPIYPPSAYTFHRPYSSDGTSTGIGFTNNNTEVAFSGDVLADWLLDQGIDLNDPNYPAKLLELAKTNPSLANRLTKVADLAKDLKSGKQISAEDMQGAIPKELAQKIGSAEVEKFSQALKGSNGEVDAGKLALALKLGHVPTAQDEAVPANQQLMENARVPETNQALLKAAQATEGRACGEGTGISPRLRCAISGTTWLQNIGYKDIYAQNTIDLENQMRRHGAVTVDAAHVKPGDFVFFDPDGGHGHVGLYAGNGMAYANDSNAGVVEKNTIASMAAGRSYHFVRMPSHHPQSDSPVAQGNKPGDQAG